jgi:hypothetical protein
MPHQPRPQPKPQTPKPQAGKPKPGGVTKPQVPVKPRDLADPGVTKDEKTKQLDPYAYKKNDRGAKLYGPDGIKALDVRQGAIGDCYLAAALAAVAGTRPDAIKNAIKDNGDGTYTVRFFEVGWDGKKTAHQETVDADLPHNVERPAYANSTEQVDGKDFMELWPSVVEKAYASWKGSYEAIGNGGNSGDVITALTGEPCRSTQTAGVGENDPLWAKMLKASQEKRPMTAGSGGEEDERYKDPKAGVYGWHAYTVMGVEEKKVGAKSEKTVTMRNPWGKRRRNADAAAVGDATNGTAGGVFQLPWAEFRRLYDNIVVQGG